MGYVFFNLSMTRVEDFQARNCFLAVLHMENLLVVPGMFDSREEAVKCLQNNNGHRPMSVGDVFHDILEDRWWVLLPTNRWAMVRPVGVDY